MTPTEPLPETAPAGWLARFRRAHLYDYNRAATLYWSVMVTLGLGVVLVALLHLASLPLAEAVPAAIGVALAMGAGLIPLRVPHTRNSLAAGEIFTFLLLLLIGPSAAVLAAAGEAVVASSRTTRRWSSRIASPMLAAVAMAIAGGAFHLVAGDDPIRSLGGPAGVLAAVIVFAVAYAAINTVLLTAVLVIKNRQRLPLADWFSNFGWVGILFAASASVSGLIFLSFQALGAAVLVATVPIIAGLLGALHLFFRVVELSEKNRQAQVDAAEREAAQAARHVVELRESEQRFHSAFTHASIGMALMSTQGRMLQVNPALCALLGRGEAELLGRTADQMLGLDGDSPLDGHLLRMLSGEVASFAEQLSGRHADGRELWVAMHGSFFADDSAHERCLILQIQDITARHLAEARLQHIAFHDGLTDLANRGRFVEALDAAIAAGTRDRRARCAVLFLDFDRFKLINDSLGHNVGDSFLRLVAERLRSHVRPGDLVARLGGDEFAVLMRKIADDHQPAQLAERLQAVFREPLSVDGHELSTSASIGIRVFGDEATTPQEILRDADTAMYRAKAGGKARHAMFDASMHAQVAEQLSLERDLRHAIDNDALGLEFQPMVSLRDGKLLGFEALARWNHPERGAIGPARFVPVAIEAGLVTQLTTQVLGKACAALAAMAEHSSVPLHMNVNVTALDLCQRGFGAQVGKLLLRHGLSARQLSLELTETMLLERLEAARETMNELREIGVGLCIDDFGTGYSSLRYLSSLPIGSLKIDAGFVQQLAADRESGEIVRAIVRLGEALGKTVIAEGIELPAQRQRLLQLGCAQGQGWLFGHAQPLETIVATLEAQGGLMTLLPDTGAGRLEGVTRH